MISEIKSLDKNKMFYFNVVSEDIQDGFFEGFQFQNPEVENTDDDLVNRIKIYRTIEGSDEVEDVSTIEDTDSIGIYGLREEKLIISSFISSIKDEYRSLEIADFLIYKEDPEAYEKKKKDEYMAHQQELWGEYQKQQKEAEEQRNRSVA
jgi:hypothetical protein